MAVWICLVLPCLISSISIYYALESNIRVKSYGSLNSPCASRFNFEHLDILCAWIEHPSEKLWPFEFLESFRCSISSDSIYYWPGSDIRVKSCGCLNLPVASIFNFEHLYILCAEIGHLSEKLWSFKFLESFWCSISSHSIYYWPESDFQSKVLVVLC